MTKIEIRVGGFEKRRAKQVFFASEAETERVFDYITENLFGNV
jgi:hypothetical protein